jgi:alginate O-acetyltransferase complex protein AlgI
VVDWWAAQWMVRAKRERTRRLWMLTSVVVNLGMLGYFKYGGFLLDNFVTIAGSLGIIYRPPGWDIVLPVGISFYTFATLSYTLDVYLRRSAPAGSFLNYALFVTFFPHLVAGPIMRPTELVPQFETPRRANANQIFFGLALLTLGLFQKVVLADGFLSPVVEAVYDAHGKVPGMLDSWVATLAFAGQIFCDFAGYSTSAIGVALCLGFAMPDNFRFPYGAIGFSDFWRRWHISLSTFLRDYLYIPLGGNKAGPFRAALNLVLVMFLGGLWHGAAWTFVVWGLLHGSYLVIERVVRLFVEDKDWANTFVVRLLAGIATYTAVCIAWVFFRASDFGVAARMLRGMFGGHAQGDAILSTREMLQVAIVTACMILVHAALRNTNIETAVARLPRWVVTAAWALMTCAIILTQGNSNAFIYFQF